MDKYVLKMRFRIFVNRYSSNIDEEEYKSRLNAGSFYFSGLTPSSWMNLILGLGAVVSVHWTCNLSYRNNTKSLHKGRGSKAPAFASGSHGYLSLNATEGCKGI